MRRRNPADAASVAQVRQHLDYYLNMMRSAAYEGEGPSVEASMDLMHAICYIHFFRGRAVELGIDNAPSEHDMEEMDSLADELARSAAKGQKMSAARANPYGRRR
jgi:hypothetical protein